MDEPEFYPYKSSHPWVAAGKGAKEELFCMFGLQGTEDEALVETHYWLSARFDICMVRYLYGPIPAWCDIR